MLDYRNKGKQYHGSVFSFGAGTQSTAILLLLMHEPERVKNTVGHLPEHIIFADTGAEGKEAIANFEHFKKISFIPMYRVKDWKNNAQTKPFSIPFYIKQPGTKGQKLRQCTRDWKIRPIRKATRKLYPTTSKKRVVSLWLGISTDEISRMSRSEVKYLEHVYPLLELNLSREDCYQIIYKYGYKPIKSACYMCPYRTNRWKENSEIDKAIAYERYLQANSPLDGVPFLHPSCKPLEKVYQDQMAQYELFDFENECQGYCGL